MSTKHQWVLYYSATQSRLSFRHRGLQAHSLLNSSMKIITKLLADRLQAVIMQLVHKNHYGFIKIRTIQDCLAWSFEYLHLCRQSRKEIIILKLDFEKAFDRMEHTAMLELMKVRGFSNTWISWMQNIFLLQEPL